ncbi:cytochrome c oxidase assembly protein COX18, mitochondrial-like isoform X2 [Leptopilina boulardi]|uniref:cytochrome c oxidase assembly protein COX18, mitochondrial-like isoform X2 n=1 Tax=Leptopilina boulardi TaxID=63433 RepID=UPI0021F5FE11|nr:cytochrome c oxidase assembly protein COX18, mitochondrial-like isoform X2 [Leptopilina boulardi]
MLKSKCLNLSSRLFLSQIRTKSVSTQFIDKKRYFLAGNFILGGPILLTVRNRASKFGVRYSSSSTTYAVDNISPILNYLPTESLREFALWIHSTASLPWWASIVLYTLIIRITIHSPISIYQQHLSYRIANVYTELEGHTWRLKTEMKKKALQNGWSKRKEFIELSKSVSEIKQKMYQRDNCHPMKLCITTTMIMLVFMSQAWAIRELCILPPIPGVSEVTSLELAVGGIGWFKNLMENDKYFILPVITAFLTYSNIKVQYMLYPNLTQSKLWKIIRKSMIIFFPPFTLLVTSQLPTAVIVSWITNNLFTVTQTILFAQPKFRRLIRLPKVENEIDQPLTLLANGLKQKLRLVPKTKSS